MAITFLVLSIWSAMVATSSAQTSIGPVALTPMLIDVSNGTMLVNVSCQFNIDGGDEVNKFAIQYGKVIVRDSDGDRQFTCIAQVNDASSIKPNDKEFTSTGGVELQGCHDLLVVNNVFTTQVATLWVTIPFVSVTNSRFWGGHILNGTIPAGQVSELGIVGMAPVLTIAQQPCTKARDCISYNVEAYVMATPSVNMSLVCGGLPAENTISENNWINKSLSVPITTLQKDVNCTVSVDGIQPQMKTETIDYESHSCPCEEYVLNTTVSPLSSCYKCSGCTYKWFTDGTLLNGETGQNLSFTNYVIDVGSYAFTSETCDGETCVNQTACINTTGPPSDMDTIYIVMGVVLGVWALMKVELVLCYAFNREKFNLWKNESRGCGRVAFYLMCFFGGFTLWYIYGFIYYLCTGCKSVDEGDDHTGSPSQRELETIEINQLWNRRTSNLRFTATGNALVYMDEASSSH